jgi:hypothetical protein
MREKILSLLIVATAASLLAGCHRELYYAPNPFEGIKTVAVAPFKWYQGIKYSEEELRNLMLEPGEIMANELTKFRGFTVIRPADVRNAIKGKNLDIYSNPEAALEAADILKADAIIVGVITDCEPYDKPRVGVAVEMFTTRQYEAQNIDWNRMMQMGRRFTFSPDVSKRPIHLVDRLFDANIKVIYDRALKYASYQVTEDRALDKEAFVKIVRNYFSYVSFEILSEIIHVENLRQGAATDEDNGVSSLEE